MRIPVAAFMVLIGLLAAHAGFANDHGAQRKAFRQTQKEQAKSFHDALHAENAEFRKTLKDKSPQEKAEALRAHHQEQSDKRKEYQDKTHEDNKADLQARLNANTKLTQEQKDELLKAFDEHYAQQAAFNEAQRKENLEFFDKIANDPNMTMEQKKQVMKDHRQAQLAKRKEHREENQGEREARKKAFREKLKEQTK